MLRHVISVILLFALATIAAAQAETTMNLSECQSQTLPQFVQDYIRETSDTWRIQESKYLGSRARERWEAEKPLGCPGIAVGKFGITKDLAYAILLVPVTKQAKGYKFVVFNRQADPHLYQVSIVEKSDNAESAALFLHTLAIGGFFDSHSQRKFQVQAQEGILFIDASEKEYEADVYFLGGGKYHRQPIDY